MILIIRMNSDGLAAKWIFYYFQFFGLHSVNEKRSWSLYYQLCLFAILSVNYFGAAYIIASSSIRTSKYFDCIVEGNEVLASQKLQRP